MCLKTVRTYGKQELIPFILTLGLILSLFGKTVYGAEIPRLEDTEIHALSAALIDGDTGRVLYQKNGAEKRANASTTKILTCILALENKDINEVVTVSEYAASMPNVQLGIESGECYYLKDLLYSLMLESHNDSAVAIAECVGGNVESFAELMNKKAEEIGCIATHFVTPNGLDETDEGGEHGTTAVDLARIMKYCTQDSLMRDIFLEITGTPEYAFNNIVVREDGVYEAGQRSFQCINRNSYLSQNKQCVSGKTGYTSDAGYCYVCTLESEGRHFVISLLASGWPPNKTCKWQDCDKIYAFAVNNYALRTIPQASSYLREIEIVKDANESYSLDQMTKVSPYTSQDRTELLLGTWEDVFYGLSYPVKIDPLEKREAVIGKADLLVEGECVESYDIKIEQSGTVRNEQWYFKAVLKKWVPFWVETEISKSFPKFSEILNKIY